MCGIAGIVQRTGSPPRALLERVAGRLAHRGPDGHGIAIDGPVGLVHTRLSIIDLAGGAQPLRSADGRCTLVANGEVYNFVELRAQWERDGRRFLTHSDSELILHAWQLRRESGIGELNGMFAFALHDHGARTLLLGRDRLGIKPLFYAALPDRVVFASEIKALLPLLGETPEIEPAGLAQFLQQQFHSGRDTVLRQVKRVLPGELLRIDTATLAVSPLRYWSPLAVAPKPCSMDEALEAFGPLFEGVVREHMRADVPFGLFLSGGIDSSLLLAALAEWQQGPVRSYSVGWADAEMADELDEATALARAFGAEHTPLRVTRRQLFERIVHSIWAADDLMRDFASLPTSLLAETAARDLKVVFSGEGGDEAFAGYRRYATTAESWLKGLLFGTGGMRTRGQWGRAQVRACFGRELRAVDSRAGLRVAWDESPRGWSAMQRRQYLDLTGALPDNLFVKADRMMMGFGLEGRVPFADHRLVEFGLALPDAIKMRGTTGKQLLRRWGERVLPPDHLKRPKRGFYVPVHEWLSGPLLDGLEQKLPANRAIRAWFRPGGVRALLARQRAKGDRYRQVWCLMQFAIWHRLVIERPGTRPGPQEEPLDWID